MKRLEAFVYRREGTVDDTVSGIIFINTTQENIQVSKLYPIK